MGCCGVVDAVVEGVRRQRIAFNDDSSQHGRSVVMCSNRDGLAI